VIALTAFIACLGIVVALGALIHARRSEPLAASPLDRLVNDYVYGDAVDGMEPWEFEARAMGIMEGRAAQAEEWAVTEEPGTAIPVRGDPRAVPHDVQIQRDYRRRLREEEGSRYSDPWEQREARLLELESQYPALRDRYTAEVVVARAREMTERDGHPERWREPSALERAYLDLLAGRGAP
jgi:hypothetical protein